MEKPSSSLSPLPHSIASSPDQNENDDNSSSSRGGVDEGTATFVPVNFSSTKQSQRQPLPKARSSSFSDSIDREQELVEKQQQQQQQKLKTSRSNEQSISCCSSNNMRHVSNTSTATTTTTTIISRCIEVPDTKRVERCLRLPEYGPNILFLSGGTAIRDLSTKLKYYTHHSIHLITPFDSGGSSAILRDHFDMLPSVGDLRNRLVALCDETSTNAAAITDLLSYRLHKHDNLLAYTEFQQILNGCHPIIRSISLPMRSVLIQHLHWFHNRIVMPDDNSTTTNNTNTNTNTNGTNANDKLFNFRGASIGNLIIVGCYVEHGYDIVTAIYWIGTLLGVKGKVRPITAANLHLRAYYKDGTIDIGQHKLGKYNTLIDRKKVNNTINSDKKKIIKIDFVESLQDAPDNNAESIECQIDMVSSELITSYADVICFPMGSFFGSIVVNLLPQGVGKAIVQRQCPKVYIPNTGYDPEMYGYSLSECINVIITTIQQDASRLDSGDVDSRNITTNVSDILNIVLVDTKNCEYSIAMDMENVKQQWPSIDIIDLCLVNNENDEKNDQTTSDDHGIASSEMKKQQFLDPTKVAEVLVTLGS